MRRRTSIVFALTTALALGATFALAQPDPGSPESQDTEPGAVCSETVAGTQAQEATQEAALIPTPTDTLSIDGMSLPAECIHLSGEELCLCLCEGNPDPTCSENC